MRVCLLLVICVTTVVHYGYPVHGQATVEDLLKSTLAKMTINDKIAFLGDFLVRHPETFQQLEDTLLAAFPILGYDPPENGLFMNLVLPWSLDKLPDVLKSHEFRGLIKIFIETVNSVDISSFMAGVPASGSMAEKRAYMMSTILSNMPTLDMLKKMLLVTSVRDIVPYNSTDHQLSGQCYDDTMTFLDRLLMGTDWALDMFDAVGKPTTGIRRGVMHFIGTYDQCLATNAYLPLNSSLAGGYKTTEPTKFAGRYCRATLPVPQGLAASIAGEHINNTYGIPLTLTLGLCLPSSCHADDVDGLLHLGFLGSLLNLTFTDISCVEELDLHSDVPALVVIGVLGGLVLLVIVASLIELSCMNKSTKTALGMYNFNTDTPEYLNPGFELEPVANGKIPNGGIHVMINESQTETDKPPKQTDSGSETESDIVTAPDQVTEEESKGSMLVRSFSIFTNVPALMATETKDGDIPCLYGIRFFSMLWVILGNTFLYCVLSLSKVPIAVNLMDSYDIMERFTFQAVLGATFSTDTFFVISGCLVTYWYLMRLDKTTNNFSCQTWLKFYLGRLWKMTPPYMLILATYSILYMYLGSGPLWPDGMAVADKCKTDWWKHLTYINNLIGVDGVPADSQCMPWSWYMAVQMQFYLITPILIAFLSFSTTIGLSLTGLLAVAGIVAAGLKENAYGGSILTSTTDGGAYWNNVFTKPWTRVSAYCVGVILGFIIHSYFHKKLHKALIGLGWVLATCFGVFLVYISYTQFELGPWSRAQEAAFEALSRPVWALCVAWVVYACFTDNAGPLNDFLSWKGFVPLSRLSFLVFLIHPVLMAETVYTKRALVHLDTFDMSYLFIGHVVVCYTSAFMFSLVIDVPFRNIKNLLHGKQVGNHPL